jgi:hypothetical protein
VIRLTICFLFPTIISTWALGQEDIENGKYFYHKENISGNFFDQPKFQIDSIRFFYSKSGDTLTYWTVGMSTPYEKKELKKIEKRKEFGKYLQRGLTLSDGRVTIHKLRPTKFLIRNDSLFQWNEVYRISEDSIKNLKTIYESSKTTQDRERVSKVIKDNTDFRFVFIFSRNLFDNGLEQTIRDKWTKCSNTVTLLSKWSTEKTDYYRFEITNDCGIWGHRWGYIISREFDFVTFGGYSGNESKELTKTALKVNNPSEY